MGYSNPPTEEEFQEHLAIAASHNAMPAAWARKRLAARGLQVQGTSPGAAAAISRLQAQVDALTKALEAFTKANPGTPVPVSAAPTLSTAPPVAPKAPTAP